MTKKEKYNFLVFVLFANIIEAFDVALSVQGNIERYTLKSHGIDVFYLEHDKKTGKLDMWREKILLDTYEECALPTDIKPNFNEIYVLLLKKYQDQLLDTVKENIDSIYEFSGRKYFATR